MPAKGTIKPDHIPVNKFMLLVAGLPPLTILKASGIEEELETVDLPDRTRASGGSTKPVTFDVATPLHHVVEQAAWEAWYKEAQDPTWPTAKKVGTLVLQSISGAVFRSFSLLGLFVHKRALPELDMANEGELATVTWTLSADDVLPV
jgi:hypothetical protein